MNWIVLLTPLLAATIILLLTHKNRFLSANLSILACGISLFGAFALFWEVDFVKLPEMTWISVPGFTVTIGALLDPWSKTMLLVVTGVGLLIHIFAYGYMREDEECGMFFAKLSFFMFSMLGIVLADNLVMMFIFWELVGLSSYYLIGFWQSKPSASAAARKAFIVNRIGDFGFILGIIGVWAIWKTVVFQQLQSLVHHYPVANEALLTAICFGLFCGCIGKSAQFPLHVWLPDAMEGPTPVSALIHAATMVAAGVYMLTRVFFIIELSPTVMGIITMVGMFTALFAALIALQQDDIKRVLAYSTLSQLGYMVGAVGLGVPAIAMFHLVTHAFFKALLFLGSGSVIHACHHEQNIWNMGGLWKKMPLTTIFFLVGTLALMGFPFTSGFWSKEGILMAAYEKAPLYFWMGALTAGLTSFYMTRLVWVTFFGEDRSEHAEHAHESPLIMTLPLAALAALSLVGGYLGGSTHGLVDYLMRNSHDAAHAAHHDGGMFVMGVSVAVLLAGASLATLLYRNALMEPLNIGFLRDKFYSDEIYVTFIVRVQDRWASALRWFDYWIVEHLLVRGSGWITSLVGDLARLAFQGGNLQVYTSVFIFGVIGLLYWTLYRVVL